MSTLEKFGILVILILVVIIGVVAVWGVGGEADNPNPFADVATAPDGLAPVPPAESGTGAPAWPDAGNPAAVQGGTPVAPPVLGGSPTSPNGGAVAPPPASTAGTSTYTVKKGDTGASIARTLLGDPNKWPLIAAANGNKDARRLKIGDVLKIPGSGGGMAVADLGTKPAGLPTKSLVDGGKPVVTPPVNQDDGPTQVNRTPAPAPVPEAGTREVEVRSGDTLYEIARRELGDANLYYKIIKANPGLEPKKLRPGMKIKLPSL